MIDSNIHLYDSIHISTIFENGKVTYRKGILLWRTEYNYLLTNSSIDRYARIKRIVGPPINAYRIKYTSAIISCPIVLIEKSTEKQFKH